MAQTADIGGPYRVEMKQMEYVDAADGRHPRGPLASLPSALL